MRVRELQSARSVDRSSVLESVRNQFRSKESSVERITMEVDYPDVESTNHLNVLSGIVMGVTSSFSP